MTPVAFYKGLLYRPKIFSFIYYFYRSIKPLTILMEMKATLVDHTTYLTETQNKLEDDPRDRLKMQLRI